MTYNSRRGFLCTMPVTGLLAYHLYNFTTSKTGNTVNLIRKSKWHSQHDLGWGILINCFPVQAYLTDLLLGNTITSLDLNPSGETVATLDCYGRCVLSDVNTHNYSFHLDIEPSNPIFDGEQNFSISLIFNVLVTSYRDQMYLFAFLY